MTLRSSSANRNLMRRMNEASVFGIIHDFGPISRADIARLSTLSLATISGITGTMIAHGIVMEQHTSVSTGGRRPVLLAINQSAALAIGAKLTAGNIVVALVDLGANLVEHRSVPLGEDLSPETVVDILGTAVADLQAAHQDRRIVGLGVGMAGVIDREAGICRFSPFLPWHDVPIRDMIASRISLPVIVENDVNALTVAERWFGAGATDPTFLVVTVGQGVGMGIMLHGALYRGSRHGAGELGHVTITENGQRCDCGKRGCLEAYIGEPALRQTIGEAAGEECSLDDAAARARTGNDRLAAVFGDAGRSLGLALANTITILNPGLIILSGEGSRYLDLMLPSLRETCHQECFDGFMDDIQLVIQPWGDDVWARGAAAVALDDYFHPAESQALRPLPMDTGKPLSRPTSHRPHIPGRDKPARTGVSGMGKEEYTDSRSMDRPEHQHET